MLKFGSTFGAALASVVILDAVCSAALAQTAAPRPLGPCQKIAVACESSGFAQGGGADGNGSWQDCVAPLMQDQARPASENPLPIIDPKLKAACLAAQPQLGQRPDERPAGGRDLTYTLSLPTVFMAQQELWSYGFAAGPSDGPFGAIPLGQGRYRFLGTAWAGDKCPPGARKEGVFGFSGTLDRVTGGEGCRPLFGASDGPPGWLFNANYSGGGQVIPLERHGKRAWLMSFRGEYHWKNPARADGLCGGGANPAFAGGVPCYYSTLGLAVSTDEGNTFRVAGESLQLTDPLTASKGADTSRNIGYGSLVVADANGRYVGNPLQDPKKAYVYLFFDSSGKDLSGACTIAQCAGVARARYDNLVSAVFSETPDAVAKLFRKYDSSSPDPWSQPGTGVSPDLSIGGGIFSPLYHGPGIGIVIYDRAFDVYLGASISFATGHPAIVIRTSTDLIHWSEPIGPPIDDGKRAVSYFTMLGETEEPSIAGSEPRIYFMSTAEGKVGFQNAVFKVVTVKLSRK
jgi:hypothetical protein